MKLLTLLTTLLFSLGAQAHSTDEVLNCSVTEPFINYTFNPAMKTLTMTSVEISPAVEVLSRNAEFKSLDPAKNGEMGSTYQVVDTVTGEVFMDLTLNNQGSDGMSDFMYPYDAKIGSWYGGCDSTSAPMSNVLNSVYNLLNQN